LLQAASLETFGYTLVNEFYYARKQYTKRHSISPHSQQQCPLLHNLFMQHCGFVINSVIVKMDRKLNMQEKCSMKQRMLVKAYDTGLNSLNPKQPNGQLMMSFKINFNIQNQ
jgi:hypothetical protein